MSGMDDVVRLNADAREHLVAVLQNAGPGDVLVAVDDIDGAVKVKTHGRWSAPIGILDGSPAPVKDSARDVRHDLTDEARVIRPSWWDRGQDRPEPSEYMDGGR